MSKLADWKLQKAKMKMEAASVKPDRPRIEQQLGLEKALAAMQKDASEQDRQIDEEMYGNLSKKWSGNGGGSSGDAFIGGLTAGLRKGSSSEEKKRNKQMMDFTEKMKNMVAEQNIQLFQQEKLANARESVTPRIMAYLDKYKTMSPNDRKVYLQNSIDEYNNAAGTHYKITTADGSEPWNITVSDGEEIIPLDLMSFIQSPAEQKLKYYLNSEDVKSAEKDLQREDAFENRMKSERNSLNDSRMLDADIKRKEHQEALDVEKEIFDKTGDNVRFINSLPPSGAAYAEKHIKEYTEKANQDFSAIKRLERAAEIAKEHPELFNNLNAIIAARYNESPGYLNNILKEKIPKKSLDAMSELSGIVKNIFTDSVKGVPSKGINQFIERKLEAGSPNQRWTASAFEKVVNDSLKEYKKTYDEHKKVADYGSEGLYYRPRAKSREEIPQKMEESKMDMSEIENKLKSIPGLTKADIDEAERRLKSGQ